MEGHSGYPENYSPVTGDPKYMGQDWTPVGVGQESCSGTLGPD